MRKEHDINLKEIDAEIVDLQSKVVMDFNMKMLWHFSGPQFVLPPPYPCHFMLN